MTKEEINKTKYWICCVKGTDKCEEEQMSDLIKLHDKLDGREFVIRISNIMEIYDTENDGALVCYNSFGKDVDIHTVENVLEILRIINIKEQYNERRYIIGEEKKGVWTDVPMGDYMLLHQCSNCLKKSVDKSKYCPRCGAKMEEVNDGNN